jgi:hypothetical protein
MKSSYRDPNEYSNIVLPILHDEWKVESETFKTQNRTTGLMDSFTFVETVSLKKKAREVYSVKIVGVRKSKFWTAVNRPAVKKVTLELFLTGAEKVVVHVNYFILSIDLISSILMFRKYVFLCRVHTVVLEKAEKDM